MVSELTTLGFFWPARDQCGRGGKLSYSFRSLLCGLTAMSMTAFSGHRAAGHADKAQGSRRQFVRKQDFLTGSPNNLRPQTLIPHPPPQIQGLIPEALSH